MSTMKSYTYTIRGPPSRILTSSTLPIPAINSPAQVLVRISHCALNPGGSIIMHLLPFLFRTSPAIPEMDFSGSIVSTGADVTNFKLGEEVFGSIPVGQHVKSTSGAMAEYVVVEHTEVVRKPENVTSAEVAGLGIAGATALELMKVSGLKDGDRVLVNGAGGGVGHLVLQMCVDRVGRTGKVVAVCSSRNGEWVKGLAAECQVIERDKVSLIPHLVDSFSERRFDAVIDCVGIQDIFHACPAFLKEGKPYVTVGPRASSYTYLGILNTIGSMAQNLLWPRLFGGTARAYVQVAAASNSEALAELVAMVAKGKLEVHVGMLVAWEDARLCLLGGHVGGKIVVEVQVD